MAGTQTPEHSRAESALGATKDAVIALLSLGRESSDIFPPLKSVFGGAVFIAEAVDAFQSNKKEWKALAIHVATLVKDFATRCEGKPSEELTTDIERLNSELQTIGHEISRLASRPRLIMIAQSKGDVAKIGSFRVRIDSAIVRFAALSAISLRQKVEILPTQIMSGQITSAFGSEAIPPVPEFIVTAPTRDPQLGVHGREAEIEHLISSITSRSEQGHAVKLAIRGGGGLGKTTLALAIFHHPECERIFGKQRYFVPCEAAFSSDLLVRAVLQTLQLQSGAMDPIQRLEYFVHNSRQPTLLVLDNFETPWYGQEKNYVRKVLTLLSSAPHLSLLVTMRGTELPQAPSLIWTKPILDPLTPFDLQAARATFADIAGEGLTTKELDELLIGVDLMPSAVHLMANLALSGNSIPDLKRAWDEQRTSMLTDGGSRKDSSLEISIRVSLESPLMKDNPSAYRVLAVICFFPSGALRDCLSDLTQIPSVDSAVDALNAAGLVHQDDLGHLKVLSPIRDYVLSQSQYAINPEDKAAVIQFYTKIAAAGNCPTQDPNFTLLFKFFQTESSNIITTLLTALSESKEPPSPDLVSGFIGYSTFLRNSSSPDPGFLERLLERSDWSQEISPEDAVQVLTMIGNLCNHADRLDEAMVYLKRAQEVAENSELYDLAACVSLHMGGNLAVRPDTAKGLEMLEEFIAKMASEEAASQPKVTKEVAAFVGATARVFVGWIKAKLGYPEGSVEYMEVTVEMFRKLPDQPGSLSIALRDLGSCYMTHKQTEKSLICLEEGLAITRRVESPHSLGLYLILLALTVARIGESEHPRARKLLKEGSKALGIPDRCQIPSGYQIVGRVYEALGESEECVASFKRAAELFKLVGQPQQAADMLEEVGFTLFLSRNPECIPYLREARSIYISLEMPAEATRCWFAQLEGEYASSMQANPGTAQTLGPKYLPDFIKVREELLLYGEKMRASGALVCIGMCHFTSFDFEEADKILKAAHAECIEVGNVLAAQECNKVLGMIAEMGYNVTAPEPSRPSVIDEVVRLAQSQPQGRQNSDILDSLLPLLNEASQLLAQRTAPLVTEVLTEDPPTEVLAIENHASGDSDPVVLDPMGENFGEPPQPSPEVLRPPENDMSALYCLILVILLNIYGR